MNTMQNAPRRRSPFDDIKHTEDDGTEWWSARELMPLLGYPRWGDSADVIDRAKAACRNSGHQPGENFRDAPKVFGARRPSQLDVHLTRFAAYLIAMNGDPRKLEIAAAQRYFAIQTYRAERMLPQPDESAEVVQLRPWSERLSNTFQAHRLAVRRNFPPGSFSTYVATVGEILMVEDELLRHQIPLKYGDLPDGSIGKRWSLHREENGLPERIGNAPLEMPHLRITVEVAVYGPDSLPPFYEWLQTVYIPEKMPDYFDNKKEWRSLRLSAASAADQACLRLTGSQAVLPDKYRAVIIAAGGKVTATLPAPK